MVAQPATAVVARDHRGAGNHRGAGRWSEHASDRHVNPVQNRSFYTSVVADGPPRTVLNGLVAAGSWSPCRVFHALALPGRLAGRRVPRACALAAKPVARPVGSSLRPHPLVGASHTSTVAAWPQRPAPGSILELVFDAKLH